MKSYSPGIFILTMALLITACSPLTIASPSGEPPTPVISGAPAGPYLQPLVVENVQVEVGIGSPLPVDIVASGTWPSLCSQIAEVKSQVDGFQIDYVVLASTVSSCPPDHVGLSFVFRIPLNIAGMKDGTYTITVNGKGTTFNLPVDQNDGTGSIFGWVWHDQCVTGLDGQPAPTSTPPGCVEDDSPIGPYHANGLLDAAGGSNEEPIAGVVVRLFQGDCSSDLLNQVAETMTIATDISYSFTGLHAGTYCVFIDPQEEVNLAILRPGLWTYPSVSESEIKQTVTLQPGEGKYDVNFGWDHQFK